MSGAALNRLRKLEGKANMDTPPQIAAWIDAGLFYDDLTPAEQERYSFYRWNMAEPPDKLFSEVLPELEYSPHFQLDRKPPPATPAEIAANMAELDALMQKSIEEYNAPEAVAKREAEYKELCRIGELRRQAFYSGRPMSDYPLPWEKDSKGQEP